MPEDEIAKSLLSAQKNLEEIRNPYEETWQDVADHVAPIREDIRMEKAEGQRLATKIYNGNPIYAVQVYVDGMSGHLIPANILWFRQTLKVSVKDRLSARQPGAMTRGPMRPYIARYEYMEDIPEIKAWLQEADIGMYRAYQRSNFYSAMTPYFEDGGTIGTATIYSEENKGEGKIAFTTMHPGQVYIAENQYGEVDTVFRKEKLTAKKAKERFGKGKLSDAAQRSLETNPYEKYPYLHAVYPRTKRNPDKLDGLNKSFASVWVDITSRKVISEWGYDGLPYHVWRYRKSSLETYGRSPAMFALADIMSLNLISKDMLRSSRMSVDPAYNVPAELLGKVNIIPHGFNYYGDDHNRIVTPVQTGINYPIGTDREDRIRDVIERHFHLDFFLMLTRAKRQMTATEILERAGEKAALMATAIGRLNQDCLDPNMNRVFQIEYRAGRLPEVPQIYWDYGAGPIGVTYLGPLAQAQRRLFKTQSITQGLIALQPLAEMFPHVLDVVNEDETAREILESNNYPQKATRSTEEVDKMRQVREDLAQAEAAKRQLMEGLAGAKTLAEADQASGGEIFKNLPGLMAQAGAA